MPSRVRKMHILERFCITRRHVNSQHLVIISTITSCIHRTGGTNGGISSRHYSIIFNPVTVVLTVQLQRIIKSLTVASKNFYGESSTLQLQRIIKSLTVDSRHSAGGLGIFLR